MDEKSDLKTGLEYVLDASRFVVGAVVIGFASVDYNNVNVTAPESVALTLILTAASVVVFTAVLMLLELSGARKNPWKEDAKNSQVYMTNLLLISTAFYAGVKTTPKQSIGDALAEPPAGTFLGVAILKVVEMGIETVGSFTGIKYEALGGDSLADLQKKAKDGWFSMVFVLPLIAIGYWSVGSSKNSDFAFVAFWTALAALGLPFFVQGFWLGEGTDRTTFFSWNNIDALLAHTTSALLALEVGREFYQDKYEKQEFLSSNFYYYAALLFALMSAVAFEGAKEMRGRIKAAKTDMRRAAAMFIAGAIIAVALWSTDISYDSMAANATLVEDKDPSAKKLALAVYANITILVLSGHVLLSKVAEMVLEPELRFFDMCKSADQANQAGGDSGEALETATHRAEGTLVFVLAAASFYSLEESKLAAIFLFVLAASLRLLGFLMVDGEDGEYESLNGKRKGLLKLVYNDKSKKLEAGQEGVISGLLTLLASAVVLFVYILRDQGPLPEGHSALRGWEFTAWILVLAHVALTFVGFFSEWHAGRIPILRLGVSSFVLVILSASLGKHALSTGDYKLLVPTIFLYALYDSASQQRF